MKSFLLSYAILLLFAFSASAQEQRVAVCTIDSTIRRIDGTYTFDVFGRRTNPTLAIFVGTSSFFFDYNIVGLGAPTLTSLNSRYTGPADASGDYLPMTVQIISNKIAVTINFVGNLSGVGQALSSTTSERLFRVSLPILDPQANANLQWDMINSGFTTSNSQPVQHTFLGGDNGPLPVQLASFMGVELPGQGVRLTWRTISEVNNYGFYIQKKLQPEVGWREIPNSFVAGHGTTNEPQTYSFVDNTTARGTWQYRLRQVDLDGSAHFTEPILVSVLTDVKESAPLQFVLFQNYPNPFNPSTEIKFSVEATEHATLEVFNIIGQRVTTLFDGVAEAGQYYKIQFDAHSFTSGVYFYRLQSGFKTQLKKLVLLK